MAHIKAATVAIGLVAKGGTLPLEVHGTGFFINSEGYVMTASHVLDSCKARAKWLKEKEQEGTEIVVFSISYSDKLYLDTNPIDLVNVVRANNTYPAEGSVIPTNLDISIAKLKSKQTGLPYLQVKPPRTLELYEDIAICGYPNGTQTLNFTSNFLGVRLSPLIQFGKIVGFMPIDEAPTPNALQTDIISTGGSSGSPIVSIDTLEVIGIAQQVIGAGVVEGKKVTQYTALVGAVYGITNYILHPFSDQIRDYFEKGKPVKFDFQNTTFHQSQFMSS